MSRSAEARRALGCAALTLAVVTGLVPVPVARADSGPVRTIVAPVLDITFADADLKRETRVERAPRKVTVTLDATVLFGKDSAKIRKGAARRLTEASNELKQRGPGSLTIVGYTDDLGSAAHGLDLSRRRARAVAGVLRRDLPESSYRYRVVGRGEADPAVPNTSERNRRVNRRVVITYQPA